MVFEYLKIKGFVCKLKIQTGSCESAACVCDYLEKRRCFPVIFYHRTQEGVTYIHFSATGFNSKELQREAGRALWNDLKRNFEHGATGSN